MSMDWYMLLGHVLCLVLIISIPRTIRKELPPQSTKAKVLLGIIVVLVFIAVSLNLASLYVYYLIGALPWQ